MKRIFLLSFLFFLWVVGYSQSKDSIKNQLEEIFQKSFDSTIIFHSYSNWGDSGEYFFIGKKNDTIYYYRYFSPIDETKKSRFGPKGSLINGLYHYNKIFHKYSNYDNLTLNDKFFFIHSEPLKNSLWERIQNDNIWNLKENEEEINKQLIEVTSDGPIYIYRLITKNEIRKLYLYSPEDYPISSIFHLRNRISDVTNWISEFYLNHKLELKKF